MVDAHVRVARTGDAEAIARVQVRTWRQAYGALLPAAALDEVTSPTARERWQAHWHGAIAAPPSPRHRVLVALEGDLKGGGVVGFAAIEPATDPDREPATDAELDALLVDPDAGRRGHGSRLLAASVDHLREAGFTAVVTWLLEGDRALREFLASAGWAPDGSRRDLDMGELVGQVRMHTSLV